MQGGTDILFYSCVLLPFFIFQKKILVLPKIREGKQNYKKNGSPYLAPIAIEILKCNNLKIFSMGLLFSIHKLKCFVR